MIIGISGKIGSGKDTVGKIIQYLTCVKENKGSHWSKDAYFGNHSVATLWLENHSDWKIKKFTGKPKQIVSILTGIPVEDLEKQEVKDRVLGVEWWYYKPLHLKHKSGDYTLVSYNNNDIQKSLFNKVELVKPTIRLILQLCGTEAMRNVIHPNIWVNALFADYKKPIYQKVKSFEEEPNSLKAYSNIEGNYPSWCITDMRFPNELQAVKDRGGITIRVNREIKHQVESLGGTTDVPKGYFPSNQHESETALDNAKFNYVLDNNGTIEELIVKVKEILTKEEIIT